jgi:hypothetical protein
MTLRVWRWGFVAFSLFAALGCPRKKTDAADAAGAAAPEAGEAPALAAASNAAEVARFGDETRVDNEPAKLEVPSAPRKSPPLGELVAQLKRGSDVIKVAKHEGFVLVTFASPKTGSDTLMGWVPESAFVKQPFVPAHCKTAADCPKPDTCVNVGGDAGLKCERPCNGEGDDKVCLAGQVCRGEGAIGDAFQPFCIAAPKKDAGAAAAKATDAGKK